MWDGVDPAGAELREAELREALVGAGADLLLSFFWPRRIPPWLLAIPRLGAFGTHPSLLPRHRGPDPYFWALRDGDAVTGVTLHALDEAYDTGPIVAQRELRVHDDDDAFSLAKRLDAPALELLTWAAEQASRGLALPRRAQRGDPGRWARQPNEEDLRIDWSAASSEVLRLVRAAAPYPGATALLGELEVEVVGARPAPKPPAALRPAEAYDLNGGVAVVCGDGAVELTRVRCEDEPLDLPSLRRAVGLGPTTG